MPIYEYKGQQYDIATDDHAVAKEKILSHLSGQNKPAAAPAAAPAEPNAQAGLLAGTTMPPQEGEYFPEKSVVGYGKDITAPPDVSQTPKMDVSKAPSAEETAARQFGITPEMSEAEKALRTGKSILYGASTGIEQTWLGGARLISDFTGLGKDGVIGVSKQLAKEQGAVEGSFNKDYGYKIAKNIGESVLQNIPTIYTGLAGGMRVAYGTMFGQSFLQTYDDSRNEGMGVGDSAARSALYGIAEILGESIGLPALFKGIKDITKGVSAKELAKDATNYVLKDLTGEELTYLSQFLVDKGYGLNPQAGLQQLFQGAIDTALVTIGQGTIMGGAGMATNKVLKELRKAHSQGEEAMPEETAPAETPAEAPVEAPAAQPAGKGVIQQGKNVTVEAAPPMPEDLESYKAIPEQDVPTEDDERLAKFDELEKENNAINEKYKTATPEEFSILNARQGQIQDEMNKLVSDGLAASKKRVKEAEEPEAPKVEAPEEKRLTPEERSALFEKNRIARQKEAVEKAKLETRTPLKEVTEDDLTVANKAMELAGYDVEMNDAALPHLKKLEKAGLIRIKPGRRKSFTLTNSGEALRGSFYDMSYQEKQIALQDFLKGKQVEEIQEKPKTKAEINQERQAEKKATKPAEEKPKKVTGTELKESNSKPISAQAIPKVGNEISNIRYAQDGKIAFNFNRQEFLIKEPSDVILVGVEGNMARKWIAKRYGFLLEPFATTPKAESKEAKEVHIEGKKEEPVTSKTIEESMDKAASKVDYTKIKAAVKNQFDQAIKRATIQTDKEWDSSTKGDNSYVTIDIPGDGTFKVKNNVERLKEMQSKITNAVVPKVAKEPSGPSSGSIEAFKGMVDDKDMENAIEYAKLKGLDPKTVKLTPAQRNTVDKYLKNPAEFERQTEEQRKYSEESQDRQRKEQEERVAKKLAEDEEREEKARFNAVLGTTIRSTESQLKRDIAAKKISSADAKAMLEVFPRYPDGTVKPYTVKQIQKLVGTKEQPSTLEMLSPGAYERALNKQVNKDREESQQEYRNVRAAVRRKAKEVAKVGSTLPLQKELNVLLESEQNIKDYLDATYKEDRRPIAFKLKAVEEEKKGNLAPEVSEFIQHIYATNPKILDGLQLSIRANKNPNNPSSANFAPYSRIVTLWKNGSGVDNPSTISHELTHSFEQMMDADTRKVVVDAWARSLEKAIKNYPGQKHQDYFDAVMQHLENPTKENYDDAVDKLKDIGYKFYQYLMPSEYWAVNGTDMLRAKLGTTWDRFVNSIKGLIEGLKSFFGMNNTYAVHKTMNKIFKGDMERLDHGSLVGYLLRGEYKGELQNIEEEGEEFEGSARERYLAQREADGRTDFPLETTPSVRDMLLGAYKETRKLSKQLIENPMIPIKKMVSGLDRAVTWARIKGIYFGKGLEIFEVRKYGGQVLDTEKRAIASVAVTNALHGAEIAVEGVMIGGVKFNTGTQMFQAVDMPQSLIKVVEIEHNLAERIGHQEAANMVQDYFEAKRSRSILDAFLKQEGIVEKAKEKVSKLEIGSDEHLEALSELDDAKKRFLDIVVARSKVKLGDESIEVYSQLDEQYPELADMMENWTAVNGNNIENLEFSGIISKKRAKQLRDIKDYVPWQRLQDDMEDVHSAPTRTSKSLTNVAKEKIFRRNAAINKAAQDYVDEKIDLDELNEAIQKYQEDLGEIDNIVDNMIHNTMNITMNSIRNHAANAVAMRFAERYTDGKKKGKLKVFSTEGTDKDGVRFNIIVNGRRIIVRITDPMIAQAVLGMENIAIPGMKYFSDVSNILRRTVTIWPQFQLRQLSMDAATAAFVSGLSPKNSALVFTKSFSSFVRALNSQDPIIKYLRSYGIGGLQSYARSPKKIIKQKIGLVEHEKLAQFTNLLDKIGDSSDLAPRVATYKQVLAETGDETLALMRAHNLIDWKRHGSSRLAVALSRSVTFMSAYANQIDVLVDALTGGGLRGKNRMAALTSLAKIGSAMAMWSLVYAFLVGGNPDYEELDDETKARNFVIPKNLTKYIGLSANILLPMNTSAAFWFKALPETIYNYVSKKGTQYEMDYTRFKTAMGTAAIDALLGPNPIPTGIKPFAEIKLNHNFFTGGTVTPKGLAGLDAEEQYNATTSELGKVFSSLTGGALNPMEMDHMVRGIFGTTGAVVMWGSNMLAGERPTVEDRNNPLWGGIIDREVGRGPEAMFYDLRDRVEPKYNTFNKLLERDKLDEADKYYNEHEKEIATHDYITGIDEALKDINKEIRRLGETKDKTMTKEERLKDIQDLQRTKNEILSDVIQFRKDAGL